MDGEPAKDNERAKEADKEKEKEDKYQRLLQDYTAVKANNAILKKGILTVRSARERRLRPHAYAHTERASQCLPGGASQVFLLGCASQPPLTAPLAARVLRSVHLAPHLRRWRASHTFLALTVVLPNGREKGGSARAGARG